MTLDDAELAKLDDSCRKYTLPRDDQLSKVNGWIRGNTKVGPVLEVAVTYPQGRYGIEIRIKSSCDDGSHSWVMIVNGLSEYVTEMSEETKDNRNDEIGDSRQFHTRKWIDVEPGEYDQSSFEVSKKMARLLQHDPSVLREEDGAAELKILATMLAPKFASSPH